MRKKRAPRHHSGQEYFEVSVHSCGTTDAIAGADASHNANPAPRRLRKVVIGFSRSDAALGGCLCEVFGCDGFPMLEGAGEVVVENEAEVDKALGDDVGGRGGFAHADGVDG